MHTNDGMVDALRSFGWITSKKVEAAFRKIDRALFVESGDYAYFDMALPTKSGQTISAPSVVATMLEWLDVHEGMKVLDVGSGSGYNAALLSELVGAKGQVVTIEKYPELGELAKMNIAKLGTGNSEQKTGNIIYVVGDGSEGCGKYAPYDRIVVTAGMPWVDETHPLVKQLRPDGKLVAPVGERHFQGLIVYDKKTGRQLKVLDVMFVPLVGKYGFSE